MPIKQLTRFYRGVNPRVGWNEDKSGIIKVDQTTEESWTALFIDLVYVAMFINIGYVLKDCGANKQSVGDGLMLFLIMFISRYSIDEYSNRFFGDDVFHRIVYFVYTFGVFIMTLNISSASEESYSSHERKLFENSELGNCFIGGDYSNGFAAGFVATRSSLILLYLMICYYDEKSREQFWTVILRHGSSLVLMVILLASKQVSFSDTITTCAIVELFCGVVVTGVIRIPWIEELGVYKYHYPLDIYEVQSRLGIFIMMVLGESMIQLLDKSYNSNHTNVTYLFQGMAFLLIFCFGMQYFDAIHRKHGLPHALRRNLWSAMAFIWSHPFIAFIMLYATVTIVKMYENLQDGENVDNLVRWQLSVSCFLVTISLALMRMLHKGFRYHLEKQSRFIHLVFRSCMGCLHLVAYLGKSSIILTISEHALIAFTLNVIDVAVSINSRNKKLAAAAESGAERSSTSDSGRSTIDTGHQLPLKLNAEDVDVSYYVDFNDRSSLIRRRSSILQSSRPNDRLGNGTFEGNVKRGNSIDDLHYDDGTLEDDRNSSGTFQMKKENGRLSEKLLPLDNKGQQVNSCKGVV